MTGARVVVADASPMLVGATVTVGLAGGRGTAMARHAKEKVPGSVVYGIEFLWLDSGLNERISDLVVGDRGSLDEHWRRFR